MNINCFVCEKEMPSWDIPYQAKENDTNYFFCSYSCKSALAVKQENNSRKEREKEASLVKQNSKETKTNVITRYQLSSLDVGRIAKIITDNFNLDELRSIIPMYSDKIIIDEVINDSNNELENIYREKIITVYDRRKLLSDQEFYEAILNNDLNRCMTVGFNAIKRKLTDEILPNQQPNDITVDKINKRLISKTKKWDELKE